jgi:hypothetical protein
MANGKGIFYYEDGNVYEGHFLNDKANGFGVFIHKNGTIYKG